MKKHVRRILLFVIILFIMLGAFPQNGYIISAEEVKKNKVVLKVENNKMTVDGIIKDIDPGRDTKPVIINGRTLMPIRALVEEMGGIVEWDGNLKTVTISCNIGIVKMHIGSEKIFVNGSEDNLEVAPAIINGRTMIPIRNVVEAIGGEVNWYQSSKTIEIMYNVDETLRGSLTFWILPNTSGADMDIIDTIQPFLNKNPKLSINIEVIDWSAAFIKLQHESVSNSGVDIVQIGCDYSSMTEITWNGMFGYKNVLMDLTDKYDCSKFSPQVLKSCILEGSSKVTNMPWFVDTRALYYRKDACQKAGVDPEKDFETWDSFKAALNKLKNVEIDGKKLSPLGMPGKNDWNVLHNFSWWIWGGGGDFFSSNNKKSIINSEGSFNGIKFYTSLFNEGLVERDCLGKNTNEIEEGFFKGEFATMFSGPWNIDIIDRYKQKGLKNIYNEVQVALVPKGPKGRFGFIGGSNLGIFESSDNKKAAVSLLNYLGSKEAQIDYAKKTGFMPASNDALEDDYVLNHPMRTVFKDIIKYGKSYTCIPEWAKSEDIYVKAFGEIFDSIYEDKNYSDSTIKKILNKAKDDVETVFEEYRK